MPTSLATSLMRIRLSCMVVTLLLGTTICADNLAFSQSRQPSEESGPDDSVNFAYRSTVSEARLVFFAADENNRTVENLHKDDFAVSDDERVIRDFRSFTRSPLTKPDVVVLLDSSDSVLPHFRQETADVLQLISQLPWNPEDIVSVLSFGDTEVRSICCGDCRPDGEAAKLEEAQQQAEHKEWHQGMGEPSF